MSKRHYAGIDIGSNAVRLLIKCTREDGAPELTDKVQLIRVPLRLGEDAFTKGHIGRKKAQKLLDLMQAYKHLMQIYDVQAYRACATSAMRDAENGAALVEHIASETGIRIEIIDGKQEAELISTDLIAELEVSDNESFLYVDVGGGSTELNLMQGKRLVESRSFNIGTIRTLSGMVTQADREAFRHYLQQIHAQYPGISVVGSGGNINKLLRLGAPAEREAINRLPLDSLQGVYKVLSAMTTQERITRLRLKPDRADVIVPAASIFLEVADLLGITEIIVPTKGLSDGIVRSLL